LKCIPQSDAHFSRFFRSFCRVIFSFSLLISLCKRQSSANDLTDDLTEFGRSFMWHKNSIGPSTVPCGTPESTVASSEYSHFPFCSEGCEPCVERSSYSVLIYFVGQSKALEKSWIPMSTCFPLSNDCSMSCMVTTSCVSQE